MLIRWLFISLNHVEFRNIIGNIFYSILSRTHPGKDISHSHDKSMSVIEPQFIIFVTATGKHTANVSEKHGTVYATEHISYHHGL